MDYTDAGYIYAITNTVNGKKYIGSTVNYKSRWHSHRSALRRGKHHSFILQKAWDKHGEQSFKFELLLICSKDTRIMYETLCMRMQDYNVFRTPRETPIRANRVVSDITKAKISLANRGKVRTLAQRQILSQAVTGRKYDDAFKAKARSRQLGVSPSEETRKRISEALTGRIVHENTRQKLSDKAKLRTEAITPHMRNIVDKVGFEVRSGKTVRDAAQSVGVSYTTYYKYVKLVKALGK